MNCNTVFCQKDNILGHTVFKLILCTSVSPGLTKTFIPRSVLGAVVVTVKPGGTAAAEFRSVLISELGQVFRYKCAFSYVCKI